MRILPKISVNLNAIALLRNRRNLPWPDMLGLARIALRAGATGITIHPRPDERHIRFSDVALIANFLKSEFKEAIFNIEGYPSKDFLALAIEYADQITLVPDDPSQTTSDHGWDLQSQTDILEQACQTIKKQKNIIISAFVEGHIEDLSVLKRMGIDKVELYTGPYAACYANQPQAIRELQALAITAQAAERADLGLNAGHDLTVENIPALLGTIRNIDELSIGHGLVADALIYGMQTTIERFLAVLRA